MARWLAKEQESTQRRRRVWSIVWWGVLFHGVGLVIDTLFHDSTSRPFGLFDMLWAHALMYVGAALMVLGGWRSATSGRKRRDQPVGALVAALGAIQGVALVVDFGSELADVRDNLGPLIYALALFFAVLASIVGSVLSRRVNK